MSPRRSATRWMRSSRSMGARPFEEYEEFRQRFGYDLRAFPIPHLVGCARRQNPTGWGPSSAETRSVPTPCLRTNCSGSSPCGNETTVTLKPLFTKDLDYAMRRGRLLHPDRQQHHLRDESANKLHMVRRERRFRGSPQRCTGLPMQRDDIEISFNNRSTSDIDWRSPLPIQARRGSAPS